MSDLGCTVDRMSDPLTVSSSVKFGTSGLRGLVIDLVGMPVRAYTLAFVRHAMKLPGQFDTILIGRDLRSSSPQIASDCAAAIQYAGLTCMDCGELPTPALALEAKRLGCPAIMVTGSHIPDDRNGLKFYLLSGEITKTDEAAITTEYDDISVADFDALGKFVPFAPRRSVQSMDRYIDRYLRFFGDKALNEMRIGVYQHSSVARDALVEVMLKLGAEVLACDRSEHFIPVDTEAHTTELIELIDQTAKQNRLDAIVSTDGDADRPLVADEQGHIIRGDVLGLICAKYLQSDFIVTPVTSGSVIERSNIVKNVIRTRVGSPYVIEAMEQAGSRAHVLGFEANGGALLGYDVWREGRQLALLPTRDAFLPILAILAHASETGKTVSTVVNELDVGFAQADRLQNVPNQQSLSFLSKLSGNRAFADALFKEVGLISEQSNLDGARFVFDHGATLHYRASGNAPELRCYVEASDRDFSDYLLMWGLSKAKSAMQLL
jgi:phosphomannomutase